MARRAFVVSLFAGLLSSCADQSLPVTTPSIQILSTATVTGISPSATTSPLPTPSLVPDLSPTIIPASPPLLPPYRLDARVDYENHSILVAEDIAYPNLTGEALVELVLAVEPNMWKGCFVLDYFSASVPFTSYILDGQRMEIVFHAPLPPGEVVTLAISYQLNMPRTAWGAHEIIRNFIFGYTGRQMNLVDWYPFVVPYDPEEGWILHKAGSYEEHLVYDPSDFEVTLRFTDLASALVVAAPGEVEKLERGWRYHLENARTFAVSMSPDFEDEAGG